MAIVAFTQVSRQLFFFILQLPISNFLELFMLQACFYGWNLCLEWKISLKYQHFPQRKIPVLKRSVSREEVEEKAYYKTSFNKK